LAKSRVSKKVYTYRLSFHSNFLTLSGIVQICLIIQQRLLAASDDFSAATDMKP
jgi:hypothetical protein